VIFDTEIRWRIVTHPMKIQHFPSLPASHTKATEPRPTKFCLMLRALKGPTIHRKKLGKFVPNFFYFVSIDKRPAMGSQPNLASSSKVVSLYKCPTKIYGNPPPKFGVLKHQILDHFFRDFRTRHGISSEQNKAWTNKNASVNLQLSPPR